MENATTPKCPECDGPLLRRQKYCSERCTSKAKWRASSRALCSICGGLTGYRLNRAPQAPRCNQCRAAMGTNAKRRNRSLDSAAERRRIAAARLGRTLPPFDRLFIHGPCRACGSVFTAADVRSRFCSDACATRHQAALAAMARGRIGPRVPPSSKQGLPKARAGVVPGAVRPRLPKQRRGRIPGVVRRGVYERDQWTCQLCGLPVDKKLHYLDPMAATLDHIECQSWVLIPDDTPCNLRLAHRSCNSKRGDKT